MKCIICDQAWNHKLTCCNKLICIQCVLKLERKRCPNCQCEPLNIKTKLGKVLEVPNTRGYTQDDPVIDNDLDTHFDSPLGGNPCSRCDEITYLSTSNALPINHQLDATPFIVNGLTLCSNCYLDLSKETIDHIRRTLELCNSYQYDVIKYGNETIQFERGYLHALKKMKKKCHNYKNYS